MQFTEGNWSRVKDLEWESWSIGKREFMKASGKAIPATVEAWNATRTETNMKENSWAISPTARVSTHGQMEKSTKENGVLVWRRARESGKAFLVTPTSASGDRPKLTAMVSINGKTETDMRVNGRIVSSMDKGQISSLTAMSILDSTNSVSLTDSANTSGRTEATMLAISRMGWNMVKAVGVRKLMLLTATLMKVNMNSTRSVDLVNSLGRVATSIRAVTRAMSAMVMVKCTGLTGLAIKVNGTTEFRTVWAGWSSLTAV